MGGVGSASESDQDSVYSELRKLAAFQPGEGRGTLINRRITEVDLLQSWDLWFKEHCRNSEYQGHLIGPDIAVI
jgi:hypothetical protein